jgi:hypothetical protein
MVGQLKTIVNPLLKMNFSFFTPKHHLFRQIPFATGLEDGTMGDKELSKKSYKYLSHSALDFKSSALYTKMKSLDQKKKYPEDFFNYTETTGPEELTAHQGEDHSYSLEDEIRSMPSSQSAIEAFYWFYQKTGFNFHWMLDNFFIYRNGRKLSLTGNFVHDYDKCSEEERRLIEQKPFVNKNDLFYFRAIACYNPKLNLADKQEINKLTNSWDYIGDMIYWDGGFAPLSGNFSSNSGEEDFARGVPDAMTIKLEIQNPKKIDEFFSLWPEIPRLPELKWNSLNKNLLLQYNEAYKCENVFYKFGLGVEGGRFLLSELLQTLIVFPEVITRIKLVAALEMEVKEKHVW